MPWRIPDYAEDDSYKIDSSLGPVEIAPQWCLCHLVTYHTGSVIWVALERNDGRYDKSAPDQRNQDWNLFPSVFRRLRKFISKEKLFLFISAEIIWLKRKSACWQNCLSSEKFSWAKIRGVEPTCNVKPNPYHLKNNPRENILLNWVMTNICLPRLELLQHLNSRNVTEALSKKK